MPFDPQEYLRAGSPLPQPRPDIVTPEGEFDPQAYLRGTPSPNIPSQAAPTTAFDVDAFLGRKPQAVAAAGARNAFFDPGRDVVEFGKGLMTAPPALVGAIPKMGALGARGFSREQLKVMNDIDSGLTVREVDDPIGYQHMTPEQRLVVRGQVSQSIAQPVQETGLYKAGGAIQDVFSGITKPAPGVTPGLARDVGAGVGSTIAGVGMGLIPGVGVPLAMGSFTASGAAEAMDEAIKKGATQEQIERAGRLGTVAGATDIVDALLPMLGSAGKVAGLIKRIGVAAVKSAFFEGGQEMLQQTMQNAIAQGIYDPERDLMQGVGYAGLVAALSGSAVGGLIGGFEKGPAAAPEPQMTEEAALRAIAGEQPASGAPPPGATTVQPPAAPAQGELPLGTPTDQLSLPLGPAPTAPTAPPAAAPTLGPPYDKMIADIEAMLGPPTGESAIPGTLPIPSMVPPPAAAPVVANPATTMRSDISDFLDFGPDTSLKGSPLNLKPTGTTGLEGLMQLKQEQRIKSAPGANTGRLARLLGPKLYGNPSEMAPVTVKEILQNSFDAIKGMIQQGEKEGNIDIKTDNSARTITVTDDGTGMTPQVLGKQFLEIAGTSKESDRASGGLGIAKMMFLFGNKNLEVTTMRNGKVAQLSTTGEQLFAALDNPKKAPDISVREPTTQDLAMFPKGRGTVIKVQIPETYKDTSTGEMKHIWFDSEIGLHTDIPVLKNSPLFDNIGVTFNGETVPIGRNFPIDKFTQFANANFDWGSARIYVSQEPTPRDLGRGGENAKVLSNGLWQFSFNLTKKPGDNWGPPINRTFYIDVSPKVKPEDPGYPFDLNRQQFAKQAGEDFQKIFAYISKQYQLEDFNLEAESFGDIQYVKFDPKTKAVTYTAPTKLVPPKPQISEVRGIKQGDKVSVKDGKLIVNGRKVPELSPKELEEFDIDVKALKIPQDQINANEVMLHDNTSMDPTGAPLTSTSRRVSLTEYAVAKFGHRFYEYSFLMGNAFKELRDAIATVTDSQGREYSELKRQAIGISYDKGYHGVSIRVPFSGSFLNPAIPAFPNDPADAALSMISTMLHEFAHLHHRSEKDLGPVIQDLMVKMWTHPTFNALEYKNKVIRIVTAYNDVMTGLNGVYEDGNVEPRGVRFQTSSNQARDGSSFGNVEPGQLSEGGPKGSNLSEWVAVSQASLGQRAGPSSGNLRTQETGGAAAADFGISANQRALDAETGPGVPAAPRHPATQASYAAAKQAIATGPTPPKKVTQGLAQAAAHADRINKVYEYAAGILELAKVNPRFGPLLRYVQRTQLMHREESTIQDHGVTLNKAWRSLGKQGENVTKFLDEITNMVYLTPQERAQGITRNPTAQEVAVLAQRVGVDRRGTVFIARLNKFFSGFLDLVTQNAIADAQRSLRNDPVALTKKLAEIRAQVAALKSVPYFPFMRFGSHYVTVRNIAGDVIEFQLFERKGLVSAERRQQRFKAEMVRQYGAQNVEDGVMPPNAMPMVGMPRALLEQIKTNLALTKGQIDALEQLALEHSPSQSFKHRFQHKNYTPGYSKDFARAFARYAFFGAKFYARVKYAGLMRDDIVEARAVGGNKATRIANYMQDHLDNTILDSKGDFGWLKGLAFMWHLGYSPAAATTNLTQLPLYTYPYLADKFGAPGVSDVRAIAAMTKAMLNVNKTFRSKGHYQNQTAFEMRAIGYGIKTSVISETQAAELAALGNQTNLLHGSAGNQLERALIGFQQGAAFMFEMSEQVNRRVTFRAALDLAQKKPNAPIVQEAVNRRAEEVNILQTVEGFSAAEAKAIVTALHAVEETQVVYGHYARPRIFRGRAGSILIFERYTQAMLMHMFHNKGATVRTLLLMTLLGGLGGLPGYEDLMGLIKAAYKALGFGSNPELDMRKWIIQQFDGSVEPDIILHGLARRGFGIPAILDALGSTWTGQPGRGLEGSKPGQNVPAPVLDFSKTVGMGQLLPVQIGKLMEPQESKDKAVAEQAQRASGAGWSIFFNMYRTIMDQKLELTDPKRWEKMLPREMGAMSKAYRAYEEGRERTRTGGPNSASTVVNYDVRDTEQLMEVIAKGLGYNVFREATKWDFVIAKQEAEAHVKLERQGLVEQFFEAHMGGIPKEVEATIEAIHKFNKEVEGGEFRGYAISGKSLKASTEQRARDKILMEGGLPQQKRQAPLIEHFRELYPEAKGVIDVRRSP